MIDNLRLTITQDDLDQACKKDKKGCMLAMALKRKLLQMGIDYGRTVEVDLSLLRFTDFANETRYAFLQPPLGQVQLARFDRGDKLEPFKLNLSRPITGPITNKKKEYKKQVEIDMSKPGRPSVHGVKRFPPRATPATLHSSQRQFGANALEKFWGEKNLVMSLADIAQSGRAQPSRSA